MEVQVVEAEEGPQPAAAGLRRRVNNPNLMGRWAANPLQQCWVAAAEVTE